MADNIGSIGNVPMQFFDPKKGDLGNRTAAACETVANNANMAVKTFGIVGGTALAADTFAGNKTAIKGAKTFIGNLGAKIKALGSKFISKNPKIGAAVSTISTKADAVKTVTKEAAEKIVSSDLGQKIKGMNIPDKFKTQIDDAAVKIKNSNLGTKVKDLSGKVANSGVVQNLKTKVGNLGTKIANSPIVTTLKNNKKLAIFAVGATALAGVLTKWAHNQGRIDQKYEDKATIDRNIGI